jgi:Skp family chaperone for outer membrane proteins
MEMLETLLRWVVAPVAGFVWLLYRQVQSHETQIAVLKSEKEGHDREFKQMREDIRAILAKLTDIEKAFRK